jgi:poly(3-hydroxybutyrate) depolymerase
MKIAKILIALLLGTASVLGATLIPTATSLSSSLNPSTYGQAVTFTAVVTSGFGAPPDGETVMFLEGKTELGTGVLSSGSATFTISTLTTGGTDNIKAEYPGDSSFSSSTSNVVKQVVGQATTTTALASSLNPSNGGQPVTFTATVTPQYEGTVTGKVTFNNGSTKLGIVSLSGGVATFVTSSLPSGTDPITAVYSGSDSFITSTSGVLNQTVNGESGTTTTTLSSSLNPSIYGQAVTFTAVVVPEPPDGETVTFLEGKTELGTGVLSSGSATFTISTLTTGGIDNVKAEYPGDSSFSSSTSNVVKQVVDEATTTTALASSLNPSNGGQSVTFTATVTPQYGGTVTGKVTFNNGSTKLGIVSLSGGVASFLTSSLPVGTDSITAVYGGSNSFITSTSNAVSQTVNAGSSGCGTGTFIDSSMTWDNIERYYEVYLPANLPATPPMVLMLHGTRTTISTGSDPTPVISLNWGWQPVADENCFILVKPASTYDPTSHQWNWNAYFIDAAFPYAQGCGATDCPDDSGFLRKLITNLAAQYNVNPHQVYVAGFSSGAQMAERVGVEISDLVAAIVPASGQMEGQQAAPPPVLAPPAALAPVSVQEWAGTLDENLWPCNYGATKYSGVTFYLDTVDDTFNYWTGSKANACAMFQTTQPLCLNGEPNNANDAPTPNMTGLTGNIATGCTNDVEVQFIWEPDVAHSFQQQYDTVRWQFFAAHPKQ